MRGTSAALPEAASVLTTSGCSHGSYIGNGGVCARPEEPHERAAAAGTGGRASARHGPGTAHRRDHAGASRASVARGPAGALGRAWRDYASEGAWTYRHRPAPTTWPGGRRDASRGPRLIHF